MRLGFKVWVRSFPGGETTLGTVVSSFQSIAGAEDVLIRLDDGRTLPLRGNARGRDWDVAEEMATEPVVAESSPEARAAAGLGAFGRRCRDVVARVFRQH